MLLHQGIYSLDPKLVLVLIILNEHLDRGTYNASLLATNISKAIQIETQTQDDTLVFQIQLLRKNYRKLKRKQIKRKNTEPLLHPIICH